jgi:2-polyprenyl-3-methyl-5-hydroxy-6-metoxy-1,4-benzoquinol methylase
MNWDYSQHYARLHPDTPEHDANLRSYFQRSLAAHLPADKGSTVLDVGCGRGYALEWLGSLGYANRTGIDPDTAQVAFARSRGQKVAQVLDSTAYLCERPETCDLILLMDVLEHVPRANQPELLQSIRGALRPGGRLLCTVPNAASPLAGHWRYVDYTHECLFTHESLEFLLAQTGFTIDRVQPVEFLAPPLLGIWPPNRHTLRWWILKTSRAHPRLVCLGEFGWKKGWETPLSANLLACAIRAR